MFEKYLIEIGIALVAAVVGYGFREYQSKARPFFRMTLIDGSIIRRSDLIEITDDLATRLNDSKFILTVKKNTTVGDLSDAKDHLEQVNISWPEFSLLIEKIFNSKDELDYIKNLKNLLNRVLFEEWIIELIFNDLSIPKAKTDKGEVISVIPDDKSGGSVFLRFPDSTFYFGRNLNTQAWKKAFDPFLEAIRYLDQTAINVTLEQFRDILEEEQRIAGAVLNDLKQLVDPNSRWSFHFYFANLNDYPVIIQNDANLQINDSSIKMKYRGIDYDCYLVLLIPGDNNRTSMRDTKTPLIVEAGSSVEFSLVTKNTQQNMKNGNYIRQSFEGKSSMCRCIIKIQRVGLFKRQKIKCPDAAFSRAG